MGLAERASALLASAADPDVAGPMAAYLKSDMPFYGVKSPARKLIVRTLAAEFDVPDAGAYRRDVLALWNRPSREEKYLAIAWARRHARLARSDQLDLFERLISEGGWWDLVDEVAIHLVGPVFRADPDAVRPTLERWIDSVDLWLRRAAIICQIGSKSETDAELLFDFIERAADESDFFIRKAIGWSLREYAKTDPEPVREFLAVLGDRLSPLSRREAGKYL